MNRCPVSAVFLMLAVSAFCVAADAPSPGAKLPPPVAVPMDFQRDIKPIFQRSCLACHDNSKRKGGFRLDDKTAAFKGSNSGQVIRPGDSGHSRIVQLVAGLDPEVKMPPKGKALSSAEVSRLRAWIDQGAVWPNDAVIKAPILQKPMHWAYIPPGRPALPRVIDGGWVRNEIDAFVLARLEAEHLQPSPEADRATLIRRLSLDLLGLPPSVQEIDAFLKDISADAYQRLVDRLLDSPHYGERWGRHWLDAARYADSDGFEKDSARPFAWRYRNWVIDALNVDLPFDQFTIEQLAGDLLPQATMEQRVATGFHRNTLTNKEGGVDSEQFRVEQVVDRVNTTARVFLGSTLGCAQCHDHKFDPFSQREYYQLFAFFNSDVEQDIPAPLPGETEGNQLKVAKWTNKRHQLEAALSTHRAGELSLQLRKWEQGLSLVQLRKLPIEIGRLLLIEPEKRNAKQVQAIQGYYEKTDPGVVQLTNELAAHLKNEPLIPRAQTLALGSRRTTHVMIRGDFLRPGSEVEPGSPFFLPRMKTSDKTRLDLARWIVDPDNPLTARVVANWIWLHYFGRGLVTTPEDFGTQGERPSHPHLLDFLATEFVRQKWSMKAMHRFIVTSSTYRQSSAVRPELLNRDPLNTLMARQNRPRLEAEIVRDLGLGVAGLLSNGIGGPSVHPPQPAGVSELTYGDLRWNESKGPDRYRRGLYTWFQRTSPYPMLMTFDAPDSNICSVRRDRTNSPLQALTLLNDVVFFECAQGLGQRILANADTGFDGRIRYAFRLCLARAPTTAELEVLQNMYSQILATFQSSPGKAIQLAGPALSNSRSPAEAAAWVAIARALLNLDEFVTRN